MKDTVVELDNLSSVASTSASSSHVSKREPTDFVGDDGDGGESEEGITAGPCNSNVTTMIPSYKRNLYLYSEQSGSVLLPNVIHSLVSRTLNYNNNPSNRRSARHPSKCSDKSDHSAEPSKHASFQRMSTLDGVYLPCLQNILGVMFFIRLSWIVGTAGTIYGFLVVLMCCAVTMLTAISMSAVATNGIVPSGGSYFIISRSLGPELGGAVGILFYIGNTLAASMYIVGAIEILITYIAPNIALFGDSVDDKILAPMYNNYRVYGTILLYLIGTVVHFGIRFVNKLAGFALICVLLSILAVFIGIFVNMNGNDQLDLCILGNRLLAEVDNCTKTPGSTLWNIYCQHYSIDSGININSIRSNSFEAGIHCDPYFIKHEAQLVHGIRGLTSGVFFQNLEPSFMEKGQLISRTFSEDDDIVPSLRKVVGSAAAVGNQQKSLNYFNQVSLDMTTSFTILVGIFFPSVTGILAGCNHSGELKDPQKSIPRGVIAAILTATLIYLISVLIISGTFDNLLLRDKFGQSVGGRLVIAKIAWPNEWIVLAGALFSSIGVALQCLAAAPKLLQAIAKDNIVPFLACFAKSSAFGEPTRALLLTLFLCQLGVLLGNVDYLAPLLSKFFLMCHQVVNLACVLQTILKTPNWRPRFHYYHWSLSLMGLVLSIAAMFMTSWYYAVLAMVLAACIYKYIEYVGAKNEWGDGIGGLTLSAARVSLLLHSESASVSTKNWRPQILILSKLNSKMVPEHKKLFSFVSQLKAGKGLTMVVSVLQGEYQDKIDDVVLAKEELNKCIHEEKVQGFSDVLVASDVRAGILSLIQVSGLGALKPNTVMLGWTSNWRARSEEGVFLRIVHQASASKMALLVPKGIDMFPSSHVEVKGTIDIWWIIHEGGLLMLLPFLLKQHHTWKNCKMRIFTVAQIEDNSTAMKRDLEAFLYALRIDAEVEIVEMMNSDISDYTYERTIRMELRNEMVQELRARPAGQGAVVKRMRSVAEELVASDGNVQDKLTQIQAIMESHTYQSGNYGEEQNGQQQCSIEEVVSSHGCNGNAITNDQTYVQLEPTHINMENLKYPRIMRYHGTSLPTKGHEENLLRMHTAVKLNEAILSKSSGAALVIIKMPAPPSPICVEMEANYLEYLETMTESLDRVLMVRGGGREFLTIYS